MDAAVLNTRASEVLAAWRRDPVLFVRQNFRVEPDRWQTEMLQAMRTERRIVACASKGPGKTTVLAWGGLWILVCFSDSQGAALSITEDNLKDNLWKELAYWHGRSELLKREFRVGAERIEHLEHPKTWFLSARSFAQKADANQQANVLAGLHGRHCFILLDEAGDMSPGVVPAAKGIFAVAGQDGWILMAGNPTSVDGALYYAAVTRASQWYVIHISGDPDDPNRSSRVDIDWAREEIETLGRDNPVVMVNVLGKFPPAGANQLMDPNEVTDAMSRRIGKLGIQGQPIIWGLDPAYSDKKTADEAVLARRQGGLVWPVRTWRGMSGPQLGDAVMFMIDEAAKEGYGPDRLFVDKGGVGTSAYDRLIELGLKNLVTGVDFGERAVNSDRYHDRRTEMWIAMRDWIPHGSLPSDNVLKEELSAPRYWYKRVGRRSKFILESKLDMKTRGVRSPNRGDAVALTFAAPVPTKSTGTAIHRLLKRAKSHTSSYDPFARVR